MKNLRLLSLLLALLLLAALPAPEAFAQEDEGCIVLESYDGQTLEQTRLSEEEAAAVPALMAQVSYYDTLEDAAADVRGQLLAGEEAVVVGVNQSYSEEKAKAVYNLAMAHTGNPKEGDYLANHCRGYSATIRISSANFLVTYTPNYATTAEQEAQVDAKVAQILATVRRGDPYETVLDIHRYLRANVTYQGGETLNHTAYSAFILGCGVCESYSSAFYRLALECGIDCRIVTGLLIDGGHAWNIVALDGKYYILDATNDVFLRCPASVQGLLTMDSSYTDDAAFAAAYPIAGEDYTADLDYIYDADTATLTLPTTDSVINYYRDVTDLLLQQHVNGITNPDFKYSTAPWEGLMEQVSAVKLGGSPSFIPHRMFYWNQAIESVTIPASVKTIYKNAFNSCINLWDVYFTGTQEQWQAITVETYNNALGWAEIHYNAEPVPEPEPAKQGLQKADDGNYYYYIDGEIAEDFTGLVENSAGRWYVLAGQVQMSYDGLMEYEGTKYLIKAGHVNTAFTGITKQQGVYYYFGAGVNDLDFEGLVYCNSMKAYVQGGEVNFNKTGVVEDNGQLLYVKYGIWRNTFKGLARTDDGKWIYMANGTFDATYTGVAKLNANWVYVENGYVSSAFSGTVTVNGVGYTVKYGVVQF